MADNRENFSPGRNHLGNDPLRDQAINDQSAPIRMGSGDTISSGAGSMASRNLEDFRVERHEHSEDRQPNVNRGGGGPNDSGLFNNSRDQPSGVSSKRDTAYSHNMSNADIQRSPFGTVERNVFDYLDEDSMSRNRNSGRPGQGDLEGMNVGVQQRINEENTAREEDEEPNFANESRISKRSDFEFNATFGDSYGGGDRGLEFGDPNKMMSFEDSRTSGYEMGAPTVNGNYSGPFNPGMGNSGGVGVGASSFGGPSGGGQNSNGSYTPGGGNTTGGYGHSPRMDNIQEESEDGGDDRRSFQRSLNEKNVVFQLTENDEAELTDDAEERGIKSGSIGILRPRGATYVEDPKYTIDEDKYVEGHVAVDGIHVGISGRQLQNRNQQSQYQNQPQFQQGMTSSGPTFTGGVFMGGNDTLGGSFLNTTTDSSGAGQTIGPRVNYVGQLQSAIINTEPEVVKTESKIVAQPKPTIERQIELAKLAQDYDFEDYAPRVMEPPTVGVNVMENYIFPFLLIIIGLLTVWSLFEFTSLEPMCITEPPSADSGESGYENTEDCSSLNDFILQKMSFFLMVFLSFFTLNGYMLAQLNINPYAHAIRFFQAGIAYWWSQILLYVYDFPFDTFYVDGLMILVQFLITILIGICQDKKVKKLEPFLNMYLLVITFALLQYVLYQVCYHWASDADGGGGAAFYFVVPVCTFLMENALIGALLKHGGIEDYSFAAQIFMARVCVLFFTAIRYGVWMFKYDSSKSGIIIGSMITSGVLEFVTKSRLGLKMFGCLKPKSHMEYSYEVRYWMARFECQYYLLAQIITTQLLNWVPFSVVGNQLNPKGQPSSAWDIPFWMYITLFLIDFLPDVGAWAIAIVTKYKSPYSLHFESLKDSVMVTCSSFFIGWFLLSVQQTFYIVSDF